MFLRRSTKLGFWRNLLWNVILQWFWLSFGMLVSLVKKINRENAGRLARIAKPTTHVNFFIVFTKRSFIQLLSARGIRGKFARKTPRKKRVIGDDVTIPIISKKGWDLGSYWIFFVIFLILHFIFHFILFMLMVLCLWWCFQFKWNELVVYRKTTLLFKQDAAVKCI